MSKSLAPDKTCPLEIGINILSGKWTLPILWTIYKQKIVRFNELQRSVGQITTKTLTDQLRVLEREKIIQRTIYPVIPPRVDYSLTDIGYTLEPVMNALCDWGNQYNKLYEKNDYVRNK